jgi:hypothetical protein
VKFGLTKDLTYISLGGGRFVAEGLCIERASYLNLMELDKGMTNEAQLKFKFKIQCLHLCTRENIRLSNRFDFKMLNLK